MAKQLEDEMDLSRADRQRRDEEVAKDCPCCEHPARKQWIEGQRFGYRVQCSNERCGMITPWLREEFLAILIWNRRPSHGLIDKQPTPEHTAGSKPNRRSSARSNAAGKRVSARKAAHTTKESSK
jgi:hypothetical protein